MGFVWNSIREFPYTKNYDDDLREVISLMQELKTTYNSILENMNYLKEQFEELKTSISLLDVWTPYTYTEYYNTYLGSYRGFTFTKKSNMKNIPYKLKGIRNLYLLTYWQKICGGLPVGLDLGNEIRKLI